MTSRQVYYSGYIEFEGFNSPGFVLPIYSRYNEDGYFAQTEDAIGSLLLQKIEVGKADLLGRRRPIRYDLYSTKVIAFRDVNHRVHLGSVTDIQPVLREFTRIHPDEAAIHLQIAEICGSREEKRVARTRMTEVIRQESGRQVAAQFRDVSMSWGIFWGLLLSHAKEASARDDLSRNKSTILSVFSVAQPRLLPASVWSSMEALLAVDPDQIVRKFKAEIMIPSAEESVDLENLDVEEVEDDLTTEITAISARSSATERIAFLFQALLRRPEIGMMLLDRYRDYDQFVTYAAQVLRARLDRRLDFGGSDEAVVASMVPTLCGTSRYDRMGKHLGRALDEYPLVMEALKSYKKVGRRKKPSVTPGLL